VWEYKLKPVEFMIFSYLCYRHSNDQATTLTLELIANGVHLTADTIKKYLITLANRGLVSRDGTPALKCEAGNFFSLPNEIFLLNLLPSVFLVYAYLLLIEDRRTHTCHPSYNTIAAVTGLSKNTALKSISVLLEKRLITVESTSYFDQRGMKWKGNNLYTILPVRSAVDQFHQGQLKQLEWNTERRRIQERQAKLARHRPRAALCAPHSVQTTPAPILDNVNCCAPLSRDFRGTEEKQDKDVASYAAPPATTARSAGGLRGTRMGSRTEDKRQIEVAQGQNPLVAKD